MKRVFVGMQIHAHDVKDEGVEVVLRNMQKAGVNVVLPCANYVYELMNSPGPEILPHNPRRKRYYTLGGTYFESHLGYYENTKIKPTRTPEKDSSEIYKAFKAIYQVRGIKLPHTFEEFKKEGMPSSWVYGEAKITKELVGERAPIHLGIQIWPPATPDDVKDSIIKAFEANVDGTIMYCYGWAPLKNFAAAKNSLKRLGKL